MSRSQIDRLTRRIEALQTQRKPLAQRNRSSINCWPPQTTCGGLHRQRFRRFSAAVATSRERPPFAKIRPDSPAPAMGLGTVGPRVVLYFHWTAASNLLKRSSGRRCRQAGPCGERDGPAMADNAPGPIAEITQIRLCCVAGGVPVMHRPGAKRSPRRWRVERFE